MQNCSKGIKKKRKNIELYAIKTANGLYLVSVKYEDNKVKYVEVEGKLV